MHGSHSSNGDSADRSSIRGRARSAPRIFSVTLAQLSVTSGPGGGRDYHLVTRFQVAAMSYHLTLCASREVSFSIYRHALRKLDGDLTN
jgi:hypothetical protein